MRLQIVLNCCNTWQLTARTNLLFKHIGCVFLLTQSFVTIAMKDFHLRSYDLEIFKQWKPVSCAWSSGKSGVICGGSPAPWALLHSTSIFPNLRLAGPVHSPTSSCSIVAVARYFCSKSLGALKGLARQPGVFWDHRVIHKLMAGNLLTRVLNNSSKKI